MKKFKVVKDTPFHTVGTVLEESDMAFYNYVKMSEGEADSVIHFICLVSI